MVVLSYTYGSWNDVDNGTILELKLGKYLVLEFWDSFLNSN